MRGRVTHSLVKALRAVPDFASLEDAVLLRIAGVSTNLFWRAGSVVFEDGSPSDALYVVLSGQARIVDRAGGDEREISRVGPGDSFGELSLLLHTTHTKKAVAVEDTELMVVPKASFQDLLEANPSLAEYFRRRLEERLTVRGEVSDAV